MNTPFDYIKTINNKTEQLVDVSGYQPYITNHCFSAYFDTVLLANEMNKYPALPKNMQYDFYYHGVRKANRFEKWLKKSKNDTESNIKLVSAYYKISYIKAREVIDILRPDQLSYIRDLLNHHK